MVDEAIPTRRVPKVDLSINIPVLIAMLGICTTGGAWMNNKLNTLGQLVIAQQQTDKRMDRIDQQLDEVRILNTKTMATLTLIEDAQRRGH